MHIPNSAMPRCLQDAMWQHFCAQHLSAAQAQYDCPVSAESVLASSTLSSYKELYVRLQDWQTLPVGLWWRCDEITRPHGQLLVATASGNGQWSWYPLLHNGFGLWDTPMAVTDLRDTACAKSLFKYMTWQRRAVARTDLIWFQSSASSMGPHHMLVLLNEQYVG